MTSPMLGVQGSGMGALQSPLGAAPGTVSQLSVMVPATPEVLPVAAHVPTPQVVGALTKFAQASISKGTDTVVVLACGSVAVNTIS